MDFNTTIDIILKDLREVREIIDDLRNYPGVPRLQVELAKSKCKSAEEVISLLKTLKPVVEPEKMENTETSVLNEVTESEIRTVGVNETSKVNPEKLIEISDDENTGTESTVFTTEKKDKKTDTSIFADTFSNRSDTLLDQFGGVKDDDVASRIKAKPVENLSDAIGINDKFLFIRELFGGSQSKYEDAIKKLNSAGSFIDARAILMSYAGYGEDNEVVKQLLDIVKRKLSSDG